MSVLLCYYLPLYQLRDNFNYVVMLIYYVFISVHLCMLPFGLHLKTKENKEKEKKKKSEKGCRVLLLFFFGWSIWL